MIMSGSNCCLWILQLHTGRALACCEGQGMFCLVVLNHMIKIRDFNFNLCKEQIKIKRRASIADSTETNPTRANLVHYKSCRVNSGIKYSKGLFFPSLSLKPHWPSSRKKSQTINLSEVPRSFSLACKLDETAGTCHVGPFKDSLAEVN